MTVTSGNSRPEVASFLAAAEAFAGLVDAIRDEQWDQPGIGEWTVRDLVGHTSRALTTVMTYLGQPAKSEEVSSAEDYYAVVKRNADRIDQNAVADRGRQAGAALGSDPADAVRAMVATVRSALGSTSGTELLTTIGGGMRLESYLPTRTFELAVHGMDIAAATAIEFTLAQDVLAEALLLAARVSILIGSGPEVLRALTGRQPLATGYSVV